LYDKEKAEIMNELKQKQKNGVEIYRPSSVVSAQPEQPQFTQQTQQNMQQPEYLVRKES
jgi:hypothetical protein